MQWFSEHWQSVAAGVGAFGAAWKALNQIEKSYRAHLAAHFPTKREFHRLEYKVDKLLDLQLGQRAAHLQPVPPQE